MNMRFFPTTLIFIAGFCGVFIVGGIDFEWTGQLYQDPHAEFAMWMAQSVYEGGAIGGSDFGVTFAVAAFLSWIYFRRKDPKAYQKRLNSLKFIFISGIFAPLLAVHTFKWTVSRARPNLFFRELLDEAVRTGSQVYLPGFKGLFGPKGYSWNSFPSGHASTCAVFLVVVYLLANSRRLTLRRLAPLAFMLIFSYTAVMAVARSMAGMHWISDSVASFFLVWVVVDFIWRLKFKDLLKNEN